MDKSRREFLSTAAWMGAAVAVGGCVSAGNKLSAGCAAMSNFKVAPMKRIRVAMVAVGSRGYWALERLVTIPGLEITAICDLVQEKIDKSNGRTVEECWETVETCEKNRVHCMILDSAVG